MLKSWFWRVDSVVRYVMKPKINQNFLQMRLKHRKKFYGVVQPDFPHSFWDLKKPLQPFLAMSDIYISFPPSCPQLKNYLLNWILTKFEEIWGIGFHWYAIWHSGEKMASSHNPAEPKFSGEGAERRKSQKLSNHKLFNISENQPSRSMGVIWGFPSPFWP